MEIQSGMIMEIDLSRLPYFHFLCLLYLLSHKSIDWCSALYEVIKKNAKCNGSKQRDAIETGLKSVEVFFGISIVLIASKDKSYGKMIYELKSTINPNITQIIHIQIYDLFEWSFSLIQQRFSLNKFAALKRN